MKVVVLLLIISACSIAHDDADIEKDVRWYKAYTMPDLLNEKMVFENKSQLKEMLTKQWYATIVVLYGAEEKTTLNHCSQYFDKAALEPYAFYEYESKGFVVLKKMCRATLLLNRAIPAKKSYIPKPLLTATLPSQWPAALAVVLSDAEAKILQNDSVIKYWQDVNDDLQYRFITEYKVQFDSSSHSQIIELIGSGDFNRDGVEDVLVSSRDTVVGGSYFNLRLFSLSVDKQGRWRLIQEYTY